MRFIHTADWHLGRLFHGTHLTDDQAHVLEQLIDVCRAVRPDALIVAGDIYDRAVPPPEAVELLDDVLSRIVLGLNVPVVLIAGNHDSPGRLDFGSRLMREQGLYVRGVLTADCEPIVFEDDHGPVHVFALPYAEPSVVQQCLGMETPLDHDSAMRAITVKLRQQLPPGARSSLVGHAFVAGGQGSESERPLSVGGAGTVDASCFAGFHYVALGHLHRPQRIACPGGLVQYCGSLLKYSFDEADHGKSVTVVEMDGKGVCQCETITLKPRREVRRVSGPLADLLQGKLAGVAKDDYLEVTLLDDGPIFDAVGRLREVYPNVMELKRVARSGDGGSIATRIDHQKMTELELFRAFHQHVTGAALEEKQELAFAAVVEDMRREEREA